MSDFEKYKLSVQSPMGKQESELFLAKDGDQLSGKMVGASDGSEFSIEDGKADGNQLSWVVKVDKPMPVTLTFTGTNNGASIEGEVTFGAFGTGPFTATQS